MPRRTSTHGWALGLAALLVASCGGEPKSDGWTLYRNLAGAKRLEIVAAPGPASAAAALAAKRLRSTREREVVVVPPGGSSDARAARVLIGDASTPGVRAALERLGVAVEGASFTFLGQTYDRPDDALVATLEDPERAGFPLSLFFACSAERVAPYVRDLTPTWKRGFRCYRDGMIAREGHFDDDGAPIQASLVELASERAALFSDEVRLEGEGFELCAPSEFDFSSCAGYLVALKRAREGVLEAFAPQGDVPLVKLRVYPDAGEKARLTRDGELSSIDPVTLEVQVVLASGLADDAGFGLAKSLALQLVGPPQAEWMLDGIGSFTVPRWWGRDKDEWLAALYAGGLVPPLEVLVDPAAPVSPHLLTPLRGALFRHVLKTRGSEELAQLWRGERALAIDETLRSEFAARLAAIQGRNATRLLERRGEGLSAALHQPFLQGINLRGPGLDERARVEGFGTRACRESLEHAASLGVNAVALVFRAFAQPPPPDFAGERVGVPLACDASDLALAATLADARALGMTTMLRPELVASGSGNWSGWLISDSPRVAGRYFADQERLLVHCALLSELCGVGILCLGTELPLAAATLHPPEEEAWIPPHLAANLERWRDTTRVVRGAYCGALTYAANLIDEAEWVELWPELDFVGIDAYPSLAVSPFSTQRASDEQALAVLHGSLRQVAALGRRHERPALVTEIGFSSTAQAWRAPSETRGPADLAEQARLYELLARALGALGGERDELAGLFVWDWTTAPASDARASGERSFTVQGKPAEHALARLFARE